MWKIILSKMNRKSIDTKEIKDRDKLKDKDKVGE